MRQALPASPGHALISGGSSGIGLALARRLVQQSWHVSLIARDQARLSAAQAQLGALRQNPAQKINIFSADVADEAATHHAAEQAVDASGPPRLVIASAGMVIPGLLEDQTSADFRRSMEVNYFGALNLVRACLPHLRAQNEGRIVLISSGAGLIGLYGYTSYAPTKFALRGFGEALRSELVGSPIGVSVVYPPDTDTPQLQAELKTRPAITSALVGKAGVKSADSIATSILKGVARGRFTIAPGLEMTMLARFGSMVPLVNKFSFDPMIKRLLRK